MENNKPLFWCHIFGFKLCWKTRFDCYWRNFSLQHQTESYYIVCGLNILRFTRHQSMFLLLPILCCLHWFNWLPMHKNKKKKKNQQTSPEKHIHFPGIKEIYFTFFNICFNNGIFPQNNNLDTSDTLYSTFSIFRFFGITFVCS